jgi:hypothetical protein
MVSATTLRGGAATPCDGPNPQVEEKRTRTARLDALYPAREEPSSGDTSA